MTREAAPLRKGDVSVEAEAVTRVDCWSRRQIWICLCLLTLLGLGLRFYRLSNQSFWMDEVSSMINARVSLDQITELSSALNNSLPTYFLLLRPLVGQTNEHIEVRARAPSALAGGLTVPVFVLLMYRWHRRWTPAFVSGLLVALNPLLLWYSQEARSYSLMLFFGILALLFYELAWADGKTGWWLGYVLAALVSFFLHKTGLIFCAVALAWHGWEVLARRRGWSSLWPHALVIAGALAVVGMKSHPPLEELRRSGSILELGYTAMTFLGGYSFGPSLTDIQSFGPMQAISRHPVQVAILLAMIFLLALLATAKGRSVFKAKETLLIASGIGVVAVASLVSAFPFNIRYTLPALFGMLGLIGFLVSTLRPMLKRGVFFALLSVAIWADYQWFYFPSYGKGDSRAVAKWLSTHQDRVKTWTVLPDYLVASLEFYLPADSLVRKNMIPSTERQRTAFPPVPDALILGRRHHLVEPEKMIKDYRVAAGNVSEIKEFTGFEIYLKGPVSRP
jgi:mannosyltransferase